MNLNNQTHTFELLTPAWAGGATPETQAEIRVPTLRGHLRQWLRLLYPGKDLDEAIFGSVKKNCGNASQIQLRLEAPVVSTQAQNLAEYTRNVPKNQADLEGYFLWPLRTKKRGLILPGTNTRFTVHTTWYPVQCNPEKRKDNDRALQEAVTAFSILGTIGTRATSGYGSVWDTSHSFPTESALSAALTFLPPTIIVRLLDGSFDNGRDALAAAAKWMRSLRVGSDRYGTSTPEGRNDHDVADPAQAEQRNAVVYRQALGLPLAQRFKRGRDDRGRDIMIEIKSFYQFKERDNDRYPSPVRVKVIRLGGKFRVLIVILRSLLLPAGTPILLTCRDRYRRTATLNHQLIDLISTEGTSIH